LICILTIEAGRNLIRDKIKLSDDTNPAWKTIAWLAMLLFIPLGIFLPRNPLLIVTGCVLAIAFLLDLSRMFSPKIDHFYRVGSNNDPGMVKKQPVGKISSITCYLIGIFICFILFNRNIAFACLGFVSIAGLFGKLVGTNFGKRRLFRKSEKTLEESLTCLSIAIAIAFLLWSSGSLPLQVVLPGAVMAVITGSIPTKLDDSLTVPVISGTIMALLNQGY
jgi:glycerol-3-phosphate acyltransferase PlsY